MKIFVFDTETTWFINKKEKDLDMQPHIIQFAWVVWDLKDWKFTKLNEIDILINPWIPIPYASSQVHHIYDIDIKDSPLIADVIDDFLDIINDCDLIIGHNIEYDEDMVKLELKRLWKEHEYNPKQISCTMKSSVNFCAIEWNGNRFKYPKLWELHKKLFSEYFIWAHDALTDVNATLRCFLELVNKDVIKINKQNSNNLMSLF